MSRNCCDIVMAGVAATTLRASQVLFSATYLDETFAFVVPDHSRELFSSWEEIGRLTSPTIAVPDVPYYIDKLRRRAPNAELRVIHGDLVASSRSGMRTWMRWRFPRSGGRRGRCCTRSSRWSYPEPTIMKIPLAYPIGRHDAAFASFINTWIDLKRKDGTMTSLYDYWVLGRDAEPRKPRWSIVRDVLHWTK